MEITRCTMGSEAFPLWHNPFSDRCSEISRRLIYVEWQSSCQQRLSPKTRNSDPCYKSPFATSFYNMRHASQPVSRGIMLTLTRLCSADHRILYLRLYRQFAPSLPFTFLSYYGTWLNSLRLMLSLFSEPVSPQIAQCTGYRMLCLRIYQ